MQCRGSSPTLLNWQDRHTVQDILDGSRTLHWRAVNNSFRGSVILNYGSDPDGTLAAIGKIFFHSMLH
jgi:hypothetical protein